jgi:Flp pilus assembly protein TadG
MSQRKYGDNRGSLTVELVVLTPVLLLVTLAVVTFGRVAEARQQVIEAARAGAEAAAVQPDPAAARTASEEDAAVGTSGHARTCADRQVLTDASHFYPGGFVTVTVVCQVPLADVAVPGMPGATTVQASSTAPIDPYRAVG